MRRCLVLLATLFALAATLALACNGGGDNGSNGGETPDGNGTPTVDGTPGVPTFPSDGAEPTPRDLDEARERLSSQLDAIGANIGAVPDDIRDQLLDRCRAIEEFTDAGDIEAICQEIDLAVENNDPGLIDLVLGQLAELEED